MNIYFLFLDQINEVMDTNKLIVENSCFHNEVGISEVPEKNVLCIVIN